MAAVALSGPLPHPVDDRVVAALDPLPAPVAIHRVVAPADGRDPRVRVRRREPAFEVGDEAERGPRRRVAAVEQGVDADATGRPSRAASSTSATRWRSLAWTPPGPIEADRGAGGRPAAPLAGRPRQERRPLEEAAVGDRGVDPRAGPGGPGGRRRGSGGPTSELPIWPGGRPTASSEAPQDRVRPRRAAAPARWASARRRSHRSTGSPPDPEAVEDDEHDRPGRGRSATVGRLAGVGSRRRPRSRGRAASRGGQAGPRHDAGHLVGLQRRAADERAVDGRLGEELRRCWRR